MSRASNPSTPSSDRSSPIGSRQKIVGEYYLGKTLGNGASGRVRLGTHRTTGKKVAIKMISKTYLNSHPTIERAVRREIALMKLIQHPNVVGLTDVIDDIDSAHVYLILEYVQGGELFERLLKRGRFSEKEARRYFQQMILGLDYCHRHLICHRDLKPENILLDNNNNIKIADFGMASLQPVGSLLETSCGSPHYASPEIVTGKPYHGAASDIWSCGIILFALLMGYLPFDDADIRVLVRKVRSGKYEISTGISRQARDLVARILVLDPAKRATMSQIMHHPWFKLSKIPLESYPNSPSPRTVGRPLHDLSEIDDRILKTIQFLWSDSTPDAAIHALLSKEPNMQRVVYALLAQHAEKYWKSENGDHEQKDAAHACHQHRQVISTPSLSNQLGDRPRRSKAMAEHAFAGRPMSVRMPAIKLPLPRLNKSTNVRIKTPLDSGSGRRQESTTDSPVLKSTTLYDRIFRQDTISRHHSTKPVIRGEKANLTLERDSYSNASHRQPPTPTASKTTTVLQANMNPSTSTITKTAALLATLSGRAARQKKRHQAAIDVFGTPPGQLADVIHSRRSSAATTPSLVSDNGSTIETIGSKSNSTPLGSLASPTDPSNANEDRVSWIQHLFFFKLPKISVLNVYETTQSRVLPIVFEVLGKWVEVRLYEKSDRQGTRCKMEIKQVREGKVRQVKCRVDIILPLHHDATLCTRVQLTQQQGDALLMAWIVQQAQPMLDAQFNSKRKTHHQ